MTTRREFIKDAAVLAGGGALIGKAGWKGAPGGAAPRSAPAALPPNRVVSVAASDMLVDAKYNPAAVGRAFDAGMRELTGEKTQAAAWSSLFSPSDVVGIKINCLGAPRVSSSFESVNAVVAGLKSAGVKENAIIVWDRFETQMRDCKFEFNTSDRGVRVYGTDALDENVRRYDPDVSYVSDFDNPEQRQDGSTASRISSIFTRDCDKIINMAILKDHGLSGVTLTLKNLAYGLCDNNRRFHGPKHIGPFMADFCARPDIRKKVVLHLVDGLEACYDQGPAPRNPRVIYAANTLWLGTDPVALDAVGRAAIDAKRKQEGLVPIKESGRAWDHIELAAQKGLGIADLDRIKIERIGLG